MFLRLVLSMTVAALAPVAGASQVTLTGMVADDAGQPIANVRVFTGDLQPVLTDARGGFTIGSLREGSYVIRFERIGVQPRYLGLDITPALGDEVDLGVIVLEVLPTTLDEILVSAPRYTMNLPGERELQQLQQAGFGHMLSEDDIDRMNPSDVEDVLRRMPGVLVGGSSVRFSGGGEISCPRGAAFVVDGVRRFSRPVFTDPERQIKAMWSYRGTFERCGVIAIETNQTELGEQGSPGEVGLRWGAASRSGEVEVESVGAFLSLPVSERFAFYPAFEARRGRRQGWAVQLAMQYFPFGRETCTCYAGAGVTYGRDESAAVFGTRQSRGAPLLLAGAAVPLARLRAVGEIQWQALTDGLRRRLVGYLGVGYHFGS